MAEGLKRISGMVVEALGLNTLVEAVSKLRKRHAQIVEAVDKCKEAGLDSVSEEARACALELSARIEALEALVVDADKAPAPAPRKAATWDSTEALAKILCMKPRAAAHAASEHNSIKDLESVKRAFCQSRNVVRACDKRIAELEVQVAKEWPLPKARIFEASGGVVYETTGQARDAQPEEIVDALLSMTAGEAVEQIADICNPKVLSLVCKKDERRTVRNAAAKRAADILHAGQPEVKAQLLAKNKARHERAEGARQAEHRATDERNARNTGRHGATLQSAEARELERKAKHAAAERARRARVRAERMAQAKRTTKSTTSKRTQSRSRSQAA